MKDSGNGNAGQTLPPATLLDRIKRWIFGDPKPEYTGTVFTVEFTHFRQGDKIMRGEIGAHSLEAAKRQFKATSPECVLLACYHKRSNDPN